VLLGFAAFVLLFRYARPFAANVALKLAIEILAMLAFLTAVLAFVGGIASPLVNLYLLPIVTAALALGKRATALVDDPGLRAATRSSSGSLSAAAGWTRRSRWPRSACSRRSRSWRSARRSWSTTSTRPRAHTRAVGSRRADRPLYLRAFSRLAEQEHDAASRAGFNYSVLMIDIEHLKELNDTYGHDAGNRAVKLVAEALTRLTRSTDLVARYGGDEFVLLLANADKAIAEEVAQRIRNVVSRPRSRST